MSTRTYVVSEAVSVAIRLRELGISSPELLRDAVAQGEAERASCTGNDVVTAPGWLMWRRTTRALREALVREGWEVARPGGLELVINRELGVALCVKLSDEATGELSDESSPQMQRRGSATANAVTRNQLTLDLQDQQPEAAPPTPQRIQGFRTYMLLHSVVGDEIRIEVSLPVAADDLNEADEWIERIVLDPILREPPPDITLDDGGPDVDVDVRRRSDG